MVAEHVAEWPGRMAFAHKELDVDHLSGIYIMSLPWLGLGGKEKNIFLEFFPGYN